jgi:hypothetical protein
MKATLTFSSNKDYAPLVYDDTRLELIRNELQEILKREQGVHMMYSTPGREEMLEEVINLITEHIDWEPTDDEMGCGSEPPITAAEMHSAAWAQKQELRR